MADSNGEITVDDVVEVHGFTQGLLADRQTAADLRAELAATQQALGETAAELEASGTWPMSEGAWNNRVYRLHRVLANPIVQAALDAFRAKEGR